MRRLEFVFFSQKKAGSLRLLLLQHELTHLPPAKKNHKKKKAVQRHSVGTQASFFALHMCPQTGYYMCVLIHAVGRREASFISRAPSIVGEAGGEEVEAVGSV